MKTGGINSALDALQSDYTVQAFVPTGRTLDGST